MVLLQCLQTQGNAWTAFLRMLAIQFSKTEPKPSIRVSRARTESQPPRSREDVRAGSGRGGVCTSAAPNRQEQNPKKSSDTSRPEVPDFYIRPLHPVKLPGEPFRFAAQLRGVLLLLPRRVPRQERASSFRYSRLRGARYVAPPRNPVNIFRATCCRTVFRCAGPSSTGALCSQGPARSQGPAATIHGPTSTAPRRHRAATASAAASLRPARRARSQATMASRSASAASSSSLITR
jgi:hypothetical protein